MKKDYKLRQLESEFKGLEIQKVYNDFSYDNELLEVVSLADSSVMLLCKDSRKELGIIIADIDDSTEDYSLIIRNIYIKQNYRNKGLANYLMNDMEYYAKKNRIKSITLIPKLEMISSIDRALYLKNYIIKRGYKPGIYDKEIGYVKEISN